MMALAHMTERQLAEEEDLLWRAATDEERRGMNPAVLIARATGRGIWPVKTRRTLWTAGDGVDQLWEEYERGMASNAVMRVLYAARKRTRKYGTDLATEIQTELRFLREGSIRKTIGGRVFYKKPPKAADGGGIAGGPVPRSHMGSRPSPRPLPSLDVARAAVDGVKPLTPTLTPIGAPTWGSIRTELVDLIKSKASSFSPAGQDQLVAELEAELRAVCMTYQARISKGETTPPMPKLSMSTWRKRLVEAMTVLGLSLPKVGTKVEMSIVNRRYRRIVSKCHPDVAGEEHREEFMRYTRARETIEQYNASLEGETDVRSHE
jgi:hypothetical protein